jgi:hypothetical protein
LDSFLALVTGTVREFIIDMMGLAIDNNHLFVPGLQIIDLGVSPIRINPFKLVFIPFSD